MLTSVNLPTGLSILGASQFPVSASPLGAVIFVNSVTGVDSRGRMKFFGSAAVSPTQGSQQGPQGDPSYPLATVFGTNGALSFCKANRGDLIVVLPGHVENLSTNATVTMVAGVTVIGCGYGNSRPTFTFTGGASTSVTMGAGTQLNNLIFNLAGVASVTAGIITASGSQIIGCRIIQSSATNQAVNSITVSGDDTSIVNTEIDASALAGGATGITSGAASKRFQLVNCWIHGDFSSFPVGSASTFHLTEMLVEFCTIVQRNATAKVVFNFTTSSTGMVSNCDLNGSTWTTAADAIANSSSTNLRWMQNFGFDDGAGVVSGVLVPAVGTIS